MTDSTTTNPLSPLVAPTIQPYQSYLPTAFSDDLSLLQKVNFLINFLNTVTTTVNNTVTTVNGFSATIDTDVVNQLTTWKNDGTLDSLINTNLIGSLSSLVTVDKSDIVNAINEVKNDITNFITINVKDYGAKGDGTTDDTTSIQNAVNAAPANSILLFPVGTYLVSNSINITRSLIVLGQFATIKAGVNGLNNAFWIENVSNVTLKDLSFDMTLIGRTSIGFKTSTNLKVIGCDFTGYSNQYGWSTYDGGVCFTDCHDILLENNFFHQHGNQYDSTTNNLNRCITIQGTNGDRAKIKNNTFYQVNQGICFDLGESNNIEGNIFEEVHDNSIYITNNSGNNLVNADIVGNTFNDKFDECIIMAGNNFNITGNIFRNSPNKFLGVTSGNIVTLSVHNNIFDNSGTTTGSFIAYRDPSYSITNLIVGDNYFLHPNTDNTSIPFYLGNVAHLDFHNNKIKGIFGSSNKIIDFVGTQAVGVLKDNYVEGDSSGNSYAFKVESSVTSCDLVVKDNDFVNCYAIMDNSGIVAQGCIIQASTGLTPHILGKNKRRNVYYSIAPQSGSWTQEDRVWNTAPAASGNMGWVCTTTGTACSVAWASSTAYTVGQYVYSGSNVYQCTTAGTSGTTAPTGTGSTVTDGGSTVWVYVSPLAVFKTFGTIGA